MGLDMKTKKKLTEETAKRYCTAGRKLKTKIIDEFTAATGYNRKYAILQLYFYMVNTEAIDFSSLSLNLIKQSAKLIVLQIAL